MSPLRSLLEVILSSRIMILGGYVQKDDGDVVTGSSQVIRCPAACSLIELKKAVCEALALDIER